MRGHKRARGEATDSTEYDAFAHTGGVPRGVDAAGNPIRDVHSGEYRAPLALAAADVLRQDEDEMVDNVPVRFRRHVTGSASPRPSADAGAAPQPVVWVKLPGMRYDKVRSAFWDVSDICAAVVAEQRWNVAPAAVRLLHVASGDSKPTATQEEGAVLLEECLPLHDAIIAVRRPVREGQRVWLLASGPAPIPIVPLTVHPRLSLDADPSTGACFEGLSRDDELTLFCTAVLSTKPKAVGKTRMALWRLHDPRDPSKTMLWPLLQQHVLLERDFYSTFFTGKEWLASLPPTGPPRKFAVLGQPGIGKSSFGLWLLVQLLRAKRTVVYSRSFNGLRSSVAIRNIVFHGGVAFRTSTSDLAVLDLLLSAGSVVHLCDSCRSDGWDACHQVVITSPDPSVWRMFVRKEGARRVVFPVYSDKELDTLRVAEYRTSISQAVLQARVRAWGPVPRQVFSNNQREVYLSVTEELSAKVVMSLADDVRDVTTADAHASQDSPHSLFLINADRKSLDLDTVTFRSAAIANRVMQRLATYNYNEVVEAMQQLMQRGVTRTVAGTLFECVVLDRFRSAGQFSVRPLMFRDGRKEALTVQVEEEFAKPTQTWPFGKLSDIATGCDGAVWTLESHRFVPTKRNFTAVDSIEAGCRLLQITATRGRHALKVTSSSSSEEGLAAIATYLLPRIPGRWNGTSAYLEVYFVVPQGTGGTFKPQQLVFADDSGVAERVPVGTKGLYNLGFHVDGVLVEVRQHVMELSLDEFRITSDKEEQRDDLDVAADT